MNAASHFGTPISRVDGRAKVTGAAKYAAEYNVPNLTHGFVVTSAIAKGRIAHIEMTDALAVDGVIAVFTHANRPKMAASDKKYADDVAPAGKPFRPLYDDRVRFSFQPVALVVAEEPEIARFAAELLRIDYEPEEHVTDFEARRGEAKVVKDGEVRYEIRGNLWGSKYGMLAGDGAVVASADRVGRKGWTVESAGRVYTFGRASWWRPDQILHRIEDLDVARPGYDDTAQRVNGHRKDIVRQRIVGKARDGKAVREL